MMVLPSLIAVDVRNISLYTNWYNTILNALKSKSYDSKCGKEYL